MQPSLTQLVRVGLVHSESTGEESISVHSYSLDENGSLDHILAVNIITAPGKNQGKLTQHGLYMLTLTPFTPPEPEKTAPLPFDSNIESNESSKPQTETKTGDKDNTPVS